MAAKIVMITSGQPSLNPRLVKEADTLSQNGYDVLVLYAYWNDWGTRMDEQLLASKKWKAIRVGGHPNESALTYFISRVVFKVAATLVTKFGLMYFADTAIGRASYFLQAEAKKHPADLYIGHNLGALAAIVKAAKKYKKPCGFDAEDFHRYELNDDKTDAAVILKTYLEDKYIPQVNYLTASSPQIAAAYQQLFPSLNPIPLINVFCKTNLQQLKTDNTGQSLKLFWFSQTIGDKRGLNDVVEALQMLTPYDIQLHLLGYYNAQDSFITNLNQSGINITYHPPIEPDRLIDFASQFDIGLALEPGFSVNNDLALSNKIFTYVMAGLAVIASNTTAQKALLVKHPEIGKTYHKGNAERLADIIGEYYHKRKSLTEAKKAALMAAHDDLNWETESKKFLTVIKDTLTA